MNTFILFSVLVPALALNIINMYLTTRPWTGVAIRSYCSSFLFIELQQLLIAVPAYINDDFPENWLIPELGQVAMTVEESVHYSIWGPDAQEEWATSSPQGCWISTPRRRASNICACHDPRATLPACNTCSVSSKTKLPNDHSTGCRPFLSQLCSADDTMLSEPYT